MQEYAWYGLVATLIVYFGTIITRWTLKILFFHLGVDLWLFPNFFMSFYLFAPKKTLWPIVSFEIRSDFFSPASLIFRVSCAAFIIYSVYEFMQDQKKIEDL